ncbi:MAG: 30S ribosomal protein S21 [Verrucomicrobia bacterium]|jgi:small subunit ribosomal protein S21|nr:30S ribosomal protein S21 [Verrucomicrobiota bacterium]
MTEIKLRKGESVERALRRLREKLEQNGIFDEMRRRRFYEKPSDVRRRRASRAIFNTARQQREAA